MTPTELKSNRSATIHCKRFGWEGAAEDNFGLPKEDDLVDQPYELGITRNEHGRVHGFFVETVFYVVWLDPKHQLFA